MLKIHPVRIPCRGADRRHKLPDLQLENSDDRAERMKIDTEYIKLDSFLKAVNIASSGGDAKMMITGGMVKVNNETEVRRGRKLYPGDRVEVDGRTFPVE
jgi:ribosome-associated protein